VAKLPKPAAVAELVDAQASGACVLRDVEVRLLSAASACARQGARMQPINSAADILAAIV
jgi:hypothetical protein